MSIEKKLIFYLFVIMVTVAVGVGAVAIVLLYQHDLETHRFQLIQTAKSQARIIEAVARFDTKYSSNYPGGTYEATLSQIREANKNFEGIGETGEFVLAKLENKKVVFILHKHHRKNSTSSSSSEEPVLSEPMARAFAGESGSMFSLDYRGKKVLAAFEPVSVLNLGLVAKIDLSEIRAPFIKIGLLVGMGGITLIVIGSFLFLRISEPLIRSVRETGDRLNSVLEGADVYYWDWDINSDVVIHDPRWIKALGYNKDEFENTLEQCKKVAHPDDLLRLEQAIDDHLKGKTETFEVEYRVLKKSGEWFWVLDKEKILEKGQDGKPSRAYGTFLNIQERKDAERALKESEGRLRSITDNTTSFIFIKDLQGRYVFVNRRFEIVSGLLKWQILGKTDHELFSKETAELLVANDKVVLESMKALEFDETVEIFGDRHTYLALRFPLLALDNKPYALCGISTDVTERKRAEEKLLQSEVIVKNSFDMIASLNMDYTYLSANPRYCQAFGLTSDQLIGDKVSNVFGEKFFKDILKPRIDQCLKGRKIKYQEWFDFPESGKKYMDVHYCPFFDNDQNVRGIIVNARDITEYWKSEEKIRKLSAAVEQSPISIMITDIEGNIEYVNPFFCKTTGYSFEEVIGKNPRLLKSGEMPVEEYKKLWETILSGNTWRGEFHNKNKNDELYWESAVISPFIEEGVVTHFLAVKENITERKNQERLLSIAQKQAMVAQKLAGVGELAAGVSHEVLNPVNIISVYNQMLQRKSLDDPYIQQFCSKVKHEIKRITKIMKSLLVFSREGNAKFEKGILKNDIEKVLALVEEEYKLDNIKFVRNWCDESVEIEYDSDKMRQVYLNLINNAKYAMPNGGTITVGCSLEEREEQNYQQFTFSDTGVGISDKVKLRIFDPFFTTKPEGEGTGMGLSVIHGIIEEHGGRIRVESKVGKGTKFTISLPLA